MSTDSPHADGTDSPPPNCTPSCCVDEARISEQFDRRITELTAETDFPELIDVSAMLLDLIEDDAAAVKPTVLELGCGSGALLVTLLKRGAARARGIDLSPGMLAVAVKRAAAADVADRTAFSQGDGATTTVEPVDWVIMDRVMCCYPDVDALLTQATGAARARIAFTVPNSRGWRGLMNKFMWQASNIPQRLGRPGCLGFVHSIDRIEARLAAAGFTLHGRDKLGLWYAAVWDKPA